MLCFQIDLKKMPLGKLSKQQIQLAYTVLNDLQKVTTGSAEPVLGGIVL